MSNSIFDKSARKLDTNEDLSEYVKRVLKQKRLSLRDVQRQSGGKITQGYVGAIVNGSCKNLSVEKLKALSAGLSVEEEELFRIARGVPDPSKFASEGMDQTQLSIFLDLMMKVASNSTLIEILDVVAELPADKQRAVLEMIKSHLDMDEAANPRLQAG
ncbi:MAG TPA: helix-turn-helix domain-containing protein [Blastocatellia bacterium]|nr:helix-turn-helix domain-containing protein [Blastocatellia bacterium]